MTFTRITTGAIVYEEARSEGSAWGDYDSDGDLDLFVANANQNNFLYRNNGDGSFTKIITGDVVNDGGSSENGSWGDHDNDGDLDLFVTNSAIDLANFLYANNGDGTFTRITDGMIGVRALIWAGPRDLDDPARARGRYVPPCHQASALVRRVWRPCVSRGGSLLVHRVEFLYTVLKEDTYRPDSTGRCSKRTRRGSREDLDCC